MKQHGKGGKSQTVHFELIRGSKKGGKTKKESPVVGEEDKEIPGASPRGLKGTQTGQSAGVTLT